MLEKKIFEKYGKNLAQINNSALIELVTLRASLSLPLFFELLKHKFPFERVLIENFHFYAIKARKRNLRRRKESERNNCIHITAQ